MLVLNLFASLYVMVRLRMNYWLMLPVLVLSGMLLNHQNGNIEGLAYLGFILPPPLGMFFVLAKPQIGIAVAVFWVIEAWRTAGLRRVLQVVSPVLIAYLVSFLLYGLWPLRGLSRIDQPWSVSIWPRGIPFGLILMGLAIWRREVKFAIAASPFFAPYLAVYSWAVLWLGLASLVPQWIRLPAFLRPQPSP